MSGFRVPQPPARPDAVRVRVLELITAPGGGSRMHRTPHVGIIQGYHHRDIVAVLLDGDTGTMHYNGTELELIPVGAIR